MNPDDLKNGLYHISWKSGGTSVAAIGTMKDGRKWIAPTNWVTPSADKKIFEDIAGLVPLEVRADMMELSKVQTAVILHSLMNPTKKEEKGKQP